MTKCETFEALKDIDIVRNPACQKIDEHMLFLKQHGSDVGRNFQDATSKFAVILWQEYVHDFNLWGVYFLKIKRYNFRSKIICGQTARNSMYNQSWTPYYYILFSWISFKPASSSSRESLILGRSTEWTSTRIPLFLTVEMLLTFKL